MHDDVHEGEFGGSDYGGFPGVDSLHDKGVLAMSVQMHAAILVELINLVTRGKLPPATVHLHVLRVQVQIRG